MTAPINEFNNFCIVTQNLHHSWKKYTFRLLSCPVRYGVHNSCANEFFRRTMRSDLLLSLSSAWSDKRIVQKVSNNFGIKSTTLSGPRFFFRWGGGHAIACGWYFIFSLRIFATFITVSESLSKEVWFAASLLSSKFSTTTVFNFKVEG